MRKLRSFWLSDLGEYGSSGTCQDFEEILNKSGDIFTLVLEMEIVITTGIVDGFFDNQNATEIKAVLTKLLGDDK